MANCSRFHAPAFPTLLGDGDGRYHDRSRNFMLGFLAQSIGMAVLVVIGGRPSPTGPPLGAAMVNIGPMSYPFSSNKRTPARYSRAAFVGHGSG